MVVASAPGGAHPPVATAATPQLRALLAGYRRLLPMWTFPFLTLGVAAVFQSVAWMAGPFLFARLSLLPRMAVLWAFAGLEYLFMSPTMNAGVEVLGMPEPLLVVVYQVMTLAVFMVVDTVVFRRPFPPKYVLAFALLGAAAWVAYMW